MTAQDLNGSITVSMLDEKIIECRARGHLRLDHVLAAQAEIVRLRGAGRITDSLYDGTSIESFEPGLPIHWVRWSTGHSARVRRVAIVGRSGPMFAVAKTFQVLMPSRHLAIFTDCAAAIAFLKSANDGDLKRGR